MLFYNLHNADRKAACPQNVFRHNFPEPVKWRDTGYVGKSTDFSDLSGHDHS